MPEKENSETERAAFERIPKADDLGGNGKESGAHKMHDHLAGAGMVPADSDVL
ncbi:hypothetical protein [Bradyrhizobium sp.]|uniref:hypothetical protein n=1 Tax=Bradyrhizobium sp. TaxID=376 RepID=UPI003C515BF3